MTGLRNHKSVGLSFALWAFIVITSCVTLRAQTYTGTIDGTVRDTSGAPVPSAALALTNTATAEVRNTTSGRDGRYAFSQLNPATYSLKVAMSGFRNYEGTGIVLDASQTRKVDIVLSIGEAKQEVEVRAGANLIATQSVNQAVTLNKNLVEQLPTQVRNPLVLFDAQAGAVEPRTGVSTSDFEENQDRFEINGARDEEVAVLIDGIPDTTGDWGGTIASPSVDSVQQFQVIRDAYDARYSRTAGGVVNVITRSGTQQYHGTALEYLQNSVFNANNFFSNSSGIAKPTYQRNDYGGNLGGPILKKHRLYGFFGAEGLRQTSPSTLITTLPTKAERNGDFSQSFNSDGTAIQTYNPFSTQPDPNNPGSYLRSSFPGDIIPASMISSVAKNVLNLLPLPNEPGTGPAHANNFAAEEYSKEIFERYDGRVDWVPSDKNSMFIRFTKNPEVSEPIDVFSPLVDDNTYPREPRWNVALGDTFTLNPTTVLSILVGGGKFAQYNSSIGYGANLAPLGLPPSLVSQFNVPTPPAFSLEDFYSLGDSTVSNAFRSMVTYGVYGSKELHAHLLQFGWYTNRYYLGLAQTNSICFSFNRYFTDGPTAALSGNVDSGDTIASFLLGTGASGDAPINIEPYTTQTDWNWFVQDAWKVRPKLTLNMGLAYELQRARTERHNRLNWFDFTAPSPLAQASGISNLEGGLEFVSNSNPFQWNAPDTNFAPRIGMAYDINQHLVWRGGYGIYYVPTITVGPLGNTGYDITNTWLSTLNNGLTPYNTLDNPFPNGLEQPTGDSAGLATGVGQPITTVERNRPTPYFQQFSGDLQYQAGKGLLLDIGYSGSQGRDLLYGYGGFYVGMNINQVPDSDLSLGNALNQLVPNPFAGIIQSGPLAQPTVLRSQLLRPYPQFQDIYILDQPGATSSFNAFVIQATERLTSGLTLLASYQRSRAMDNSSEDQGWEVGDEFRDYYNLAGEKSISAHDIPNSLALSYVYDLPVGSGRKFGGTLNRLPNAVIGGWQVSGIWTLESGLPLIFGAPTNEFNYSNWQFPNINPSAPLTVSHPSTSEWFNTAAFSEPAPFTYGNAPRYIGELRYSDTNNWDLALAKNFTAWRERLNWQLRLEMYNAFNRVQFGRPDTMLTAPSFGQVTSEAPGAGPRTIQLALRLQF